MAKAEPISLVKLQLDPLILAKAPNGALVLYMSEEEAREVTVQLQRALIQIQIDSSDTPKAKKRPRKKVEKTANVDVLLAEDLLNSDGYDEYDE